MLQKYYTSELLRGVLEIKEGLKTKKKKKLFFNKKSQLVFAESMMITCGCMLLGVPLIGSGFGSGDSYYEVTLAGKTVGSVKNPSVVENAYLQARARISRETDGLVLADVEYELDKVAEDLRLHHGQRYAERCLLQGTDPDCGEGQEKGLPDED